MKKILLAYILLTHLSFSATPEQVEQYLTISQAEEQLLSLESQFSAMQSRFKQNDNNTTTYDLQLLSIRFRDYLERNISENEMIQILDNYRTVSLLHFINAASEAQSHEENETKKYVATLMSDPEAQVRIELVDNISKKFYPKEGLITMFDGLMKPLMQNGIGADNVNKEMIARAKKNYIDIMLKAAKEETLFATREFSMKELEELMKIAKTSAVDHESKVVFGAMVYALKDFFTSMTSRYNVKKHQQKSAIQ